MSTHREQASSRARNIIDHFVAFEAKHDTPEDTWLLKNIHDELVRLWEICEITEKLLREETQGRIHGSTFDELRVVMSEYHYHR